jgi:type 1 glutamine amidotransferase
MTSKCWSLFTLLGLTLLNGGSLCLIAETPSPIRVLIVDGYSNHDWRRTTKLLTKLMESTGRFVVSVSTAPTSTTAMATSSWQPPFSQHDVVIQTCNDLHGGPSWPRPVQQALEDFVRNGGGLLVFHAANNAFLDWPEYDRMIGLGWRPQQRGWAVAVNSDGSLLRFPPGEGRRTTHGPRGERVVVRLGAAALHTGLPACWKTPQLEIYQYPRGAAENLVILSYAYDSASGLNWPIEWTVAYGRGHVYGSTFGHIAVGDGQTEALRCVGVQTVLIRALQWLAQREPDWPVPTDFPDESTVQLRPSE